MNNLSKITVSLIALVLVGGAGVVRSQTTTPEVILDEVVAESASTTNIVATDTEVGAVAESSATTSEEVTVSESNTQVSEESPVEPLVSETVITDPFATNTPPFLSITSPVSEKSVTGVVSIIANASDKETSVAGVQFFLDGKELGQPMFKEPYVVQDWHSTGTPNGVHILKVVAYDTEGKTTESSVSLTFANDEADIKLADEPPLEPTIILQASGGPAPKVKAGSIEANVTIENISSCKQCKNASPEASVLIYVTPWYPNDGIDDAKATTQYSEKSIFVPVLKRGGKYVVSWSGSITTPGKYYFVAVVDPDNTLGAKRTTRSVFEVQ